MGRVVASWFAAVWLAAAVCVPVAACAENLSLPRSQRWVQVASERDLDEAIHIASSYVDQNARVVVASNGWYAVVVGPYRATTIDQVRSIYRGAHRLPSDAYITTGTGYAYSVWPEGDEEDEPEPTGAASAEPASIWDQCAVDEDQREADPVGVIDACTALIDAGTETGDNLAIAYASRGAAYGEKGNADAAITDLDYSLALDPDSPWALVARGVAYYDNGDLDAAVADYDAALRLDPEYTAAYGNRGLARADKGDLEAAMADYNTAIRLDPELAAAYVNRGNAHHEKGDLDAAIADYDTAIRLDPDFALAYNNRGIARRDNGDLDAAIADYDTATRLDPEYADAYSNRGNAHNAKGDLDAAMADYDTAIRLDPEYSSAYNNRGLAHAAKGDLDAAIADYDTAIRLDPSYYGTYYNRGVINYDRERYTDALADLTQAVRLGPDNADTWFKRCQTYLALDETALALADIDRVLSLAPDSANGHQGKGVILAAADRYEEAIASYDRALDLDPGHVSAHRSRAEAFAATKDFNGVLGDIASLINLNAITTSDRTLQVDAYIGLGRLDSAAAALDETIKADPDAARAYGTRGTLRLQASDMEGALADFTELTRINPKFGQYYRGVARLIAGRLPHAQADLKMATAGFAEDAFPALWLELAERRAGLSGHLREATPRLDMTKWPAPIVYRLLGELTPDALTASAEHADPDTQASQLCDVAIFNGELALIDGDTATAEGSFVAAARTCEPNTFDAAIAAAELHALKFGSLDAAIAADPTAVAPRFKRGVAYDAAGNTEAALADFDAVLAIDPDHSAAHLRRGRILYFNGDLVKAKADFDRVRARAPGRTAAAPGSF